MNKLATIIILLIPFLVGCSDRQSKNNPNSEYDFQINIDLSRIDSLILPNISGSADFPG